MPIKTCQNPKCNKTYNTEDKVDDGFCSDDCWAEVNCKEPETIECLEIM
jgi:hypothetical protein